MNDIDIGYIHIMQVQEWCIECVRLAKIHFEGTVFHARALLCLAEGFGYCGDSEQALVSGKVRKRKKERT